MARYTKKNENGCYYIEGENGKLESDIRGRFYGKAIDRLAELENADVVPKSEAIDEFAKRLKKYYDSLKGQAPSTAIIVYHIDQIAKEMKEKNNGNEN